MSIFLKLATLLCFFSNVLFIKVEEALHYWETVKANLVNKSVDLIIATIRLMCIEEKPNSCFVCCTFFHISSLELKAVYIGFLRTVSPADTD